jgi:hypothetical protein
MVHPNSLKNLTGPKRKKEGNGYRNCLPREKIDQLFVCLAEGMSIKRAAKEADMDPTTARRYFREGDASRGIQPLISRLTVFQQKIDSKLNVLLEEKRMERLETIQLLLKKANDNLMAPQKFYDIEGNEIQVYNKDGEVIDVGIHHISIRDIERLMKLEAFLVGGVTKEVESNSMMTAEQIDGQ